MSCLALVGGWWPRLPVFESPLLLCSLLDFCFSPSLLYIWMMSYPSPPPLSPYICICVRVCVCARFGCLWVVLSYYSLCFSLDSSPIVLCASLAFSCCYLCFWLYIYINTQTLSMLFEILLVLLVALTVPDVLLLMSSCCYCNCVSLFPVSPYSCLMSIFPSSNQRSYTASGNQWEHYEFWGCWGA